MCQNRMTPVHVSPASTTASTMNHVWVKSSSRRRGKRSMSTPMNSEKSNTGKKLANVTRPRLVCEPVRL